MNGVSWAIRVSELLFCRDVGDVTPQTHLSVSQMADGHIIQYEQEGAIVQEQVKKNIKGKKIKGLTKMQKATRGRFFFFFVLTKP